MAANDIKPYLSYLSNQQSNTIILIIILLIKSPINTDYSTLTEKIETNPKAPKYKFNDRIRITKHKIIIIKGYT